MPKKNEEGRADYVLYGNDSRARAIIEVKRTCVDVSKNRQQARLYGKYPVIFLTNGFDIRIDDGQHPER